MFLLTCALVVAATVFGGTLAGENVDRLVVQMPAWRRIGAGAWAAYSRQADLRNGLIFYPLVAIGGAVLSAGAVVAFQFAATAPHAAAAPLYLAMALALGGLLVTVRAAPERLSL